MQDGKMIPRIFIDTALQNGLSVTLSDQQAHYIRNVLRLTKDSKVLLFNGSDGEWMANIAELTKKHTSLICTSQTKPQREPVHLKLICALIKPQRIEWLVEKATELGVTHIQPIVTDHCHIRKTNLERLKTYAIEAAEQSERLSVPVIHDVLDLRAAVHNIKEEILFADESRDQQAFLKDVMTQNKINSILIGPEGGFSDTEKAYLYSRKNIHPVHLGSNILRTETADIALIAAIQAICGDWSV